MNVVLGLSKVKTFIRGCPKKLQALSSLSIKPTKFKINRKGFVTVLVAVLTCGTVVWFQISTLNRKISTVTNVFEVDRQTDRQSEQYISLFDAEFNTDEIRRKWKAALDPRQISKEPWFAWLQSRSLDPWRLLQLTRSRERSVRHLGVEALADIDSWDDFQYRNIAQAVDGRTIVGLARSCDIDLRFFLQPPKQRTPHNNIHDELTNLLMSLPYNFEDKCIQYFTQAALKHGRPPDDKGGFWSFGGQTLASPDSTNGLSEKTVELCSLQALVRHSTIKDNCIEIVERGGLILLQRIVNAEVDCFKTQTLVARILANLSLIDSLHHQIIVSGWVTMLANWMKSDNLALSTTAAKTLGNLDKDFTSYKLDDGVYVFHPVHRSRSVINADVVFIHGVNGGSFKSWRQPGFQINKTDNGNLSACWPKDWLAKDVRNIRIISIDYDTHLSEWNAKCPHDTQKRSLVKRGEEMIKKLRKAGVGDRPIIWCGHSLGGLLVKQILSLSIEDTSGNYTCFKNQTKGVIFYGVPHHGSPLAKLSSQASYILFPSIEVQELHNDSPNLHYLHSRFLDFMKLQSIPCLSFGEEKKTNVGKTLPLVHIVPPVSSDTGYGEYHLINVDHIQICKPADRDAALYLLSMSFIKNCTFSDIT